MFVNTSKEMVNKTMSKTTNLPDCNHSLNPDDADNSTKKVPSTLQSYLATAPEIDRDNAANQVEKVLFGQLFGEINLKPGQIAALSQLSRKFIEQAATLKEEPDAIDTLALLTEAVANNSKAFTELTHKAEEYYEIELERRKRLDDSMKESLEVDNEITHIPDLTGGAALTDPLIEASLLIPLNQEDADGSFGFPKTFTEGVNLQSPENNRLNEVSDISGDGLYPPPVSASIPHRSS